MCTRSISSRHNIWLKGKYSYGLTAAHRGPCHTARRVAATLLVASLCALAQSYPAGPVRVIVPFPPGGGVDSMGRILTQKLTESFGKQFIVDNRGGANGMIGS